jgi:hypothetical protein
VLPAQTCVAGAVGAFQVQHFDSFYGLRNMHSWFVWFCCTNSKLSDLSSSSLWEP